MRKPNGYGSISELSGNRRKRFMVRKTIGKTVDHETGTVKYNQVIIGFAATKRAAEELLASYNANPYDLTAAKTTFAEVYERMYAYKETKVSESSLKAYQYAFNNCEPLHNRIFADLKLQDLENHINNCDKNYPTLKKIKVLWGVMYEYALKYDIVGKDYSKHIDLTSQKKVQESKPEQDKHFTHEEVKALWTMRDDDFIQSILALIWTGVRIGEFLQLRKSDVNLEEHYFTIPKGKTINAERRVPIADAVYPFFEKWYHDGDYEYLFHTGKSRSDKPVSYDKYLNDFKKLMKHLEWSSYTPHATRHTFNSLLADIDISNTVRAKLMGHAVGNVTETVYTHLDMGTLLDAVNKLECFIE